MVGGRVSKSSNNVILTTNVIRQHMGLPESGGTAHRRCIPKGPRMTTTTARKPFAGRPMAEVIGELTDEIRELYTADEVPWIVGYSGGKDSTAIL